MKKTTLSLIAAALSTAAFAQVSERTMPLPRMIDDAPVRHLSPAELSAQYSPETVVWSEDFANGIPATWMNYGTAQSVADPDAVWEYRGATTTPNTTVGSRGAYSGLVTNPNYTSINSATKSNGFVVFDSDFLDNAGTAGNFCAASGIAVLACAPHMAHLETSMIDLTQYTAADLIFTQYYRRFAGPGGVQSVPATYLDFSTDGGTTWFGNITLNANIAVNSATPANDVVVVNVGSYIGGQDSVKIRFRFDGDYYFWQIDDIQINSTPKHRMAFTDNNGAPAQDIVFGAGQDGARQGHQTLKQARPVAFDANVYNSGTMAQNNVKLQMKIFTNAGVVQTINSPVISSLPAGDTASWNDLNTYASAWTPSAEGVYGFTYNVMSDSTVVTSDTLALAVTDSTMSLDFGSWDNSIGASTSTYHGDGFQTANRIDLVDDELLFGAKVYVSSNTVAGGILELGVYDSSAFGTNGFDPNKLVAYGQHVVTAADVAQGFVRYDFTDPTTGRGVELDLADGAFFFNVTQYDNQGANYLAIRNDQTFGKLAGSGYFYLPNAPTPGWYSGYSNSLAFNNIWVRSIYCPASSAASCMLSVDENPLAELALAPNPATDYVNVSFGMLTGQYQVEVLDLTGKVVKSELVRAGANVPVFVGNLDRGLYMVRVAKGADVKTFKVSLL
ncbi:MAG: hypothetical protein RL738_535 [Bacteroidota bacterium]